MYSIYISLKIYTLHSSPNYATGRKGSTRGRQAHYRPGEWKHCSSAVKYFSRTTTPTSQKTRRTLPPTAYHPLPPTTYHLPPPYY